MVDIKILPSNGLPGNYVIWRKKEGKKFALRIRQKRRDLITRFIVRNADISEAVKVSLCMLDRIRPYAAFPMINQGRREVGFIVGQFFLLVPFQVLKTEVKESIGDKNFTHGEMIDTIFEKSVPQEP